MNDGSPHILVFARMSSTRLRGKSLMPLGRDVVLGYVLGSLRQVELASGLTVATSSDPTDDPIAEWCAARKVGCYRGSLDDVAHRALTASKAAGVDAFVRVSGDSPLLDPTLVDYAIALFNSATCDVVTNVFPRSFPRGQSVEVVRRSALDAAYELGINSREKEHVTAALYASPESYVIVNFTTADLRPDPLQIDFGEVNLAVDSPWDLEVCRRIVDRLHPEHPWQVGWQRCATLQTELSEMR